MNFLFMTHSGLRWLILLVLVFAIVKFALGSLKGGEFKGMDRGLMAGFSGLMDLQAVLGLILLLWNGFTTEIGFPRYRLEHAFIMILAAVAAPFSARWKNADVKTLFRNNLIVIIVSLVLVVVGIAMLPGGWSR